MTVTRRGILALFAALALAWGLPGAEDDVFTDDFAKEIPGRWQTVRGEWKIRDGVMAHEPADFPHHDCVVADFPFTEGMIEVKGIARKANSYRFASLGIVIKHVDDDNHLWFRFGSYNSKNVDGKAPDGFDKVVLGVGQPDLNRKYDLTVIARNGLIFICIDDTMIGVLRDPLAGKAGRPGLFSESGVEYDDFRVTRWAK